MPPLDREEYIEQAYFFRTLAERSKLQQEATQDLLLSIRDELLSTTKLPLAIEYLSGELKLSGIFSTAMAKLSHYFTPFQAFVVSEAESDKSKLDFQIAMEILFREAQYRADTPSPQGIFLYQFESICRNRLGYDRGLKAVAEDHAFNEDWKEWILTVRRQIGLVDFADLLYVRSEYYLKQRERQEKQKVTPEKPVLFGEKEGKIAFANRTKNPLFMFSALARHLGYPMIPKAAPPQETPETLVPALIKRLERLEARLALVEEEQKGGIDLNKFMAGKDTPLDRGGEVGE